MLRTRRVENLRHGALTTTAGTREGSTITATASPPKFVIRHLFHLASSALEIPVKRHRGSRDTHTGHTVPVQNTGGHSKLKQVQ